MSSSSVMISSVSWSHFSDLALLFNFHHRTCPKTDHRFNELISKATQNFDTFEDFGSNLDSNGGKKRIEKASLDQFFDYHYRRTRKPVVKF